MDELSKEERDLLYRLVNNGIEATLAEIDEDYMDHDVPTKYMMVQRFLGLEKKGIIVGQSQGDDNWYVDMYGMLNIVPPVLTPAGREYFDKMEKDSLSTQKDSGFGDSVDLAYSLQKLMSRVLEQGGEDTGELMELCEDLKEMIANLEQTKQIIKNSNFVRRLGIQWEKRRWFCTSVMEILGQAVLRIATGGLGSEKQVMRWDDICVR